MNISNAFVNKNKIQPYAPGELSGLSFAVKDNIDIANEITGYGSPGWIKTHSKAVVNAICVEQLLAAGGTCLGKTQSDELAYSLMGINPFYGIPLNPKAPDRVPGGSSSGSASAVASKLVDFAIGTDTAGSIRVPASNCGVWGYRPSHGLISISGVSALAPSFDTVGVIAETGEILAKIMQILFADNFEKNSKTLSICFVDDVFAMATKEICDTVKPILSNISKLTKTQSITLADITDKYVNCDWLFQLSVQLLSAEVWNTFSAWIENEKPELSPEITYNFNNYAKPIDRKKIQANLYAKQLFSQKLNKFLHDGNILCFPTTVDLAPKLNEITPEFFATGNYIPRAMGINAISSLSRTPQITIPVVECKGVPIGLSFVAGYGQDLMLMDFCKQLGF